MSSTVPKYMPGTEMYDSSEYRANTFQVRAISEDRGKLLYQFEVIGPDRVGTRFSRSVKEVDANQHIVVVDREAKRRSKEMQKLIDDYRKLDSSDRLVFSYYALNSRTPSAAFLMRAVVEKRGYDLK